MLIPLQDALKPYQNRKLQHRGLVVDIADPKHLGRIKCKVEGVLEAHDIERLPWCYPKEGISRGGRNDSAESSVPPLHALVMIEFPSLGDSPVGGGSPYYPVWSGMQRVDLTNPGVGVTNGVTEDGGLSEPYGGGASPAEDLETNVWSNTQSGNVSWIRVDKFLGSIEFFAHDSTCLLRIDRGGHVQLTATSLDVVTSESVRFDVGKNFHAKVAGECFFEVEGDIGMKTASNFARNVALDIDDIAGQSIRETAGDTLGLKAGADLSAEAGARLALKAGSDLGASAGGAVGLQAGSDLGGTAGNSIAFASGTSFGASAGTSVGFASGTDFGVSAGVSVAIDAGLATTILTGGAMSIIAGVIISETAPIIARDAADLADNQGLALPPLSTPPNPGQPPGPPGVLGPLGVNATVMQELAVSSQDVIDRANALATMAGEMLAAAQAMKAEGLAAADKIRAWADAIVGATI